MATEKEKEKRSKEIQYILDAFVNNWNANYTGDLRLVSNAAKTITETYFSLHEKSIQPYLKEGAKSNRFKVAAGTEIACMATLPIQTNDVNLNRKINALFAAHAALTMLFSISFHEIKTRFEESEELADLCTLLTTHVKWLAYLKCKGDHLYDTPTFLNAQFWEAISFAAKRI